jgi:glycosyltransferase involved in cell wall biosynthesis
VNALRASGVEVEVIALPWRRPAAALAENLRPWPDLRGLDVIVEDQLVHPAVFARHQLLRAAGLPVVALVHNLSWAPGSPAPALPAAIERAYFATVDGVIAVCQNTMAEVRALAPLPGVVARAGRDHLVPSPTVPGDGPLRLLFVGTVMPHKGLHRLLDALAGVPAPTWTLDVVGSLTADAAYATHLRTRAAANVRWHGEQHEDALWARYRNADVLVLPSDREAYSLAALDALGFGLPVLATDRGGMAELVTPAEGLVIAPDAPSAWAQAVLRLAGDRPCLAAMSAAARARFAGHGTWRDTASVIDHFLRAILARTGPLLD